MPPSPQEKPLQVTVTSYYPNKTTTTTYYNQLNPHCAHPPSKTPDVVIVPKPSTVPAPMPAEVVQVPPTT